MNPRLAWDTMLADGFAPYWGDPLLRARIAKELLPWLVSELLARPSDAQHQIAATISATAWPQLVVRHAGARGHGWPDLMGAAAAALTLVLGKLPQRARDYLAAQDLFTAYERLLLPYQRFLLAVGHDAVAIRVLLRSSLLPSSPTGHLRVPPALENEPQLVWRLSASQEHPPIAGRSHTALLALLALERSGQIVLPTDAPLAITGELAANGQDLLPVSNLELKKGAWRRDYPTGWLVTSPPQGGFTIAEWARLLHAGHPSNAPELPETASRKSYWRPPSKSDVSTERWLCGGSLDEVADKLACLPAVGILSAWDGTSLSVEGALDLQVREQSTSPQSKQQFAEVIGDDLFFNLCWSIQNGQAHREVPQEQHAAAQRPRSAHASMNSLRLGPVKSSDQYPRGRHRPSPETQPKQEPQRGRTELAQGVLIYGGPGSGKSILLRQLFARFVGDSLGLLGLAVRVSARAIAEELRQGPPDLSLVDVLARVEPARSAALLRAAAQKRLFVLLDGLDEIGHAPLAQIGKLLRDARATFVATARPTHDPLDAFPPFLCCKLEPLDSQRVRSYLEAHSRADLAVQLTGSGYLLQQQIPAPLKELCETPLALSLLCRMVGQGEPLQSLHLSDLYQRAFNIMLARATTERRLGTDQAEMLRRTAPKVLGDLAWTWVSGEDNYVTDEQIRACLEEQNDIHGQDVLHYQLALELGSFIVPGNGRREFGHKTIAEWAAAAAVVLRVERKAARSREHEVPIDWAMIEEEIWTPLLRTSNRGKASGFHQVLLFFASRSHAPLSLLRMVCRLARQENVRFGGLGTDAKTFAAELAAQIPWRDANAAQEAWAFLVRHSLFEDLGEKSETTQTATDDDEVSEPTPRASSTTYVSSALKAFVDKIGNQLPEHFDALVRCVARTRVQRQQLLHDRTSLLPYCSQWQAPAFAELLDSDSAEQFNKVAEFFTSHGLPIPEVILDRLSVELPRRLATLEKAEEQAENRRRRSPTEDVDMDYLHGQRLSLDHGSGLVLPEDDEALTCEQDDLDEDIEDGEPIAETVPGIDRRHDVEQSERAVYAACIAQGYLLPLDSLRDRLLCWPSHLGQQLAPILNLCVDCLSPLALRDYLLLLIAWSTSYQEALSAAYQELAAREDRDLCAAALHQINQYSRHYPQHGTALWKDFCAWAKTHANWVPPEQSDGTHDAEAQVAGHHIQAAHVRATQAVATVSEFLKVIQSGADYQVKIAAILEDLPARSAERKQIITALCKQGPIPECSSLTDLLGLDDPALFEKTDRIPRSLSGLLHSLAMKGNGSERLCGLIYTAPTDEPQRREFLVRQLDQCSDTKFLAGLRAYLQGQYRWLPAKERMPFLTDQEIQSLPLKIRAEVGVAGWEVDLLLRLGERDFGASDAEHQQWAPLYELVSKHKLIAATTILRRHLLHAPAEFGPDVLPAYIAVSGEVDVDVVGAILAWSPAQIPSWILSHVGPAQLPGLMKMEEPPRWADDLRSWLIQHADAQKIIERWLTRIQTSRAAIYEAHAARAAALEAVLQHSVPSYSGSEDATAQLRSLRSWERLLLSALLVLAEREEASVEQLVDLALREGQTVGGASQSTQHPEWTWDLPDYGSKEHPYAPRLASLLKVKLSAHPPSEQAVRRLLSHPAAAVRDGTLEILLARAESAQKPALLISAIEGVCAAEPKEDRSVPPSYGRSKELLSALRERLTTAHREFIGELSRHPLPVLRAQAALWIGELGIPTWLPMLIPGLEDTHPSVFKLALASWSLVGRNRRDELVVTEWRRDNFTVEHWSVLIDWILDDPFPGLIEGQHRPHGANAQKPRAPLRLASLEFLDEVAAGALAVLERPSEGKRPSWSKDLRLERWVLLLARIDLARSQHSGALPQRSKALESTALLDLSRTVESADLRRALLWTLIRRGKLDLIRAEADRLLAHDLLTERMLGAECHLRLGAPDRVEEIASVWREACVTFQGTQFEVRHSRPGSRLAESLLCANRTHMGLLTLLHVSVRRASYLDSTLPFYITPVGRQHCASISALREHWQLPARQDEQPEPDDDDGYDVFEDYSGQFDD